MSISPQNKGRLFEKEIADEFSLYQTPASGAFWFSKLDVVGYGTRWSCKFTEKGSFRLTKEDLQEAIRACQGPGGDGSIPLWIIRLQEEQFDFVVLRKEDFKLLLSKDISITGGSSTKSEIKKKRSSIPQLLREEESEKN